MLTVLSEAIRTRVTPASPRTQGQRALTLLGTDPRRALIAAEAIYDRFPESLDALELWAEVNWRRGCIPEAKQAWQRLAEHDATSAAARDGLARIARAEGSGATAVYPARGGVALHRRDRFLLIEVELDGRPLLAACDTGGTGLTLAAHLADHFPGGAHRLRVGDAAFEDVDVQVIPFPEGYPLGALLGLDLFANSAVEIDAEAAEVRWFPSQPNGDGSPLWFTGHHWITPVRIDGVEEPVVVDLSSPHTMIDERFLRGEPLRGTQLPFRYVTTLEGSQEVFYAPRTFLSGREFELFHDCLTLRLFKGLPEEAVRPAGVLGLDVARRVRLDYPARRAVISC